MDYIVSTPGGEVKGAPGRVPGTVAYKGIRYATAGRWEEPTQVTKWEGIYDAAEYGACSYQPRAFYDEEQNQKKYFYYNEFRKGETYAYSEDCLFLNIFTPEAVRPGDKLPVLFYIHGGGFTGGCGHEKHFDGPVWPQQGIIGVTINYRLGPMGFACLPQLQEEAGHTGNYALYDMMTALQWIRDNIAAFGGDPEKVTIMGQSAGAASVQLLCQSPLTDGLFAQAVMSSGCGLGGMMSGSKPEKTYDFWRAVMDRCGCKNLEEFRAVAPEKLFGAWDQAKSEIKGAGAMAAPVTDGLFCVERPQAKPIHYMAGLTSEDVAPPVLYAMGRKFCASQSKVSYFWFFNRQLPGDDCGAWHSADLWYWFGTLENCWRPLTKKDRELSRQMVGYLCNFVKTGNPNGGNLRAWTAANHDKRTLILGEGDTRMGKPSLPKLVWTLLTNKAVGE